MKRILCPKCENYLFFDETKYSEGQSLVFECEHCGKQFSIRLGKSKVKALRKEENLEEEAESHKEEFGYITVIENVFGYKQILPLQEGDNVIGRRCVGTSINTPIESGDMSMDRRHCIINIKRNKQGKLVYTLRDAPSLTGTFLMNEILGDKGGVRADGAEIVPNDAPEIMNLLKELWATGCTKKVTEGVLAADFIWGEDLNKIPGLAEAVKVNLDSIQEKGMLETVKGIL